MQTRDPAKMLAVPGQQDRVAAKADGGDHSALRPWYAKFAHTGISKIALVNWCKTAPVEYDRAKGITPPGRTYPACLGGARACPPEDCGGVTGYEELLEVLGDPSHEEHGDTVEWLKGHAQELPPLRPGPLRAGFSQVPKPKEEVQARIWRALGGPFRCQIAQQAIGHAKREKPFLPTDHLPR